MIATALTNTGNYPGSCAPPIPIYLQPACPGVGCSPAIPVYGQPACPGGGCVVGGGNAWRSWLPGVFAVIIFVSLVVLLRSYAARQ